MSYETTVTVIDRRDVAGPSHTYVHLNGDTLVCNDCAATAPEGTPLQRVHTADLSDGFYVCEICDWAFVMTGLESYQLRELQR